MFQKIVVFSVGGQKYAMDSMYVNSVEAGIQIDYLPGAPACICGITKRRGELVPVCDLYTKFNLSGTVAAGNNVIVMNTSSGLLGCRVDAINEIGAVAEDLQVDLPTIAHSAGTDYVSGIVRHNGDLITVVNHNTVLTDAEKKQLDAALNTKNDNED